MISPTFNAGSLAHLRLSNTVPLTVVLLCISLTREDAEHLPTLHVICGLFFWVTCQTAQVHTFRNTYTCAPTTTIKIRNISTTPKSSLCPLIVNSSSPQCLATTDPFSFHLGLAFSRMSYKWNQTLFSVLCLISFHDGVWDTPTLYQFVPFYCTVVFQRRCFFIHQLNDIWVMCRPGKIMNKATVNIHIQIFVWSYSVE